LEICSTKLNLDLLITNENIQLNQPEGNFEQPKAWWQMHRLGVGYLETWGDLLNNEFEFGLMVCWKNRAMQTGLTMQRKPCPPPHTLMEDHTYI